MPPTPAGKGAGAGAKRRRVQVEVVAPSPSTSLPVVCYLPSQGATGGDDGAAAAAAGHDPTVIGGKRMRFSVAARAPKVPGAPALTYVAAVPSDEAAAKACSEGLAGTCKYVGTNQSKEYAAALPCSYVLGLYDPASGRLRLTPIGGGKPFRLEPRLGGLAYAATAEGAREGADGLTADQRKLEGKRLVDQFGSTRRRRQMVAREEGIVRADKISAGEQVEGIFAGAVAKGAAAGLSRSEVLGRSFAGRTVPPHNPDATTPREAYPLELLLGSKDAVHQLDIKQLLSMAEDRTMEEKERDKWQEAKAGGRDRAAAHTYVLDRLVLLRNEPDKARRKASARYLALLGALLRLQVQRSLRAEGGLEGAARALRVREEVAELLLAKFYTLSPDPSGGPGRYERSDAQGKLLVSTLLAVALAVEDGLLGEAQFDALRAMLQVEATKLADQLQQLGAVARRSSEAAADGVPRYTANLLRNATQPNKTLKECFPTLREGKAKGR